MENKGFWIKKYCKDNWSFFLFGLLVVAVFGYFALGKAMGIAQPKAILICSVIIYTIVEIYHFIKYLMYHGK